jgi:tetratricopeptide (TPR) repeat protein
MKLRLLSLAAVLALVSIEAGAQARGPQAPASAASPSATAPVKSGNDPRAEAYYDYTMGHIYQQEYQSSNRSEDANQAIDFFKKAYQLDPHSGVIGEQLARMYFESQRIRDAVTEAQQIIQRDPSNLPARRLLAQIYIRALGDLSNPNDQRHTIGLAIDQLQQVVRLDPSDTGAALWLARLDQLSNQTEDAGKVLQGVLATDPDNEEAAVQLARLLLDQNKGDEAVTLLEGVIQRAPSARLYDELGDTYTQMHEGPEAVGAYRHAVELEPDQASHLSSLAQALFDTQKYQTALGEYQKLVQMEPDNAINYLRLAEIYRSLHQLDKAEQEVLLAKKHAPGNLEVLYTEASIYDTEGRFPDAIRVISDAISSEKEQAKVMPSQRRTLAILYQLLGQLYRDSGNTTAAVNALKELGGLGPEEDQRARLLIIDTYRDARDLPDAFEEARQALAAYPNVRDLRINEALLYGEANQPNQAAQILKPMLENKPSDVEIYIDLAQVYEQGRRFGEAEQSLRAAEKVVTRAADRETIGFLQGANYERQKKYAQAEQVFKGVLAIDPHNAPVLNYYGYMLANRGVRLDEAISLVQRALAEDPGNAAYLDSLGWAYYKEHRLAEAENYLRQAISHNAHDPTILTHLGDILASDGHADLAAVEWEKALAEWRRVLPADFEADKVAELQRKISDLKRHIAQQNPFGEVKPQQR